MDPKISNNILYFDTNGWSGGSIKLHLISIDLSTGEMLGKFLITGLVFFRVSKFWEWNLWNRKRTSL